MILASVITSCGSGSSLTKENVGLTLTSSDDGFAFPNFGAVGTKEIFDGSDLAAMFGGVACVDGVVAPCIPTAEAASWAQMVNQARANGHCEGIVVQAASRYNKREMPKTVQLNKDTEVDHAIMRAFATQFLPEVQTETNGWQKKSLEDILSALGNSFRGPTVEGSSLFGIRASSGLSDLGSAEYTMGLYSEAGGHAVLPYAIDYPDDHTAIIHVYDSNWPGRSDRFIRVDLNTNEWFFSFSGQDPNNDACQWNGKQGDMDLTSLTTRVNAIVPFGSGSETVKGSMLVIKAKAGNWSVTTSAGTYSPSDGKKVEGITANSIKAASVACGKPALTEYTVYTTDSDVELNLPDAASVIVVNDGAITQVQTQGQDVKKPIKITPKKVSVDDENVQLTVAQGNKIARVNGEDTNIEIEDAITVNVTSPTGGVFTQVVDENSPQLLIETSTDPTDPAKKTIVVTEQTADKIAKQTTINPDGKETVKDVPSLEIVNVVNQNPIEDLDVETKNYSEKENFVPPANTATSSTVTQTPVQDVAGSSSTVAPSSSVVATTKTTIPRTTTTLPPVTTTLPPVTTTLPPVTTTSPPATSPPATSPPTTATYNYPAGSTYLFGTCTAGGVSGSMLWTYTGVGNDAVYTSCQAS